MKLKCAILDDYQNVALNMADWDRLAESIEVVAFNQYIGTESELIKELHQFEIIVIMRERTPFNKRLIENLPKLRLLVTSGMRNKAIDLETAKSHGIVVSGTKNSSESAVELTWALILASCRFIPTEVNNLKIGKWQTTIGIDINGKKLGILGLGKIGSRVAKIGQAFGMEIIAWSQNLTKEQAESCGVSLASSKEELLTVSDIVSIHLLLSERTKDLIGAKELKLMKKNALLINTSRAEIVNYEALVGALTRKSILGAALDVFTVEPLPQDSIFRVLDNVVITPHIGYVTENNYYSYFGEAVENIEAFLNNQPIREL